MSIISELENQIEVLHKKIVAIQDGCNHPLECLTHKYGASTGNYDPYDNCYWTDYHCQLCGKKWTERGSNKLPKCHREPLTKEIEE